MNKAGYIYILSNPDLDGLLKVGMTSKNPIERAKQLSGTTGVASKYVVEYFGKVEDRFIAEKAAHSRLKNFHHRKEFFKICIGGAIYCVETISCSIERKFIQSGNEIKVLQYAKNRLKGPYKQIEREWREREQRRKRYEAEQAKIRNWENMVEDYMSKRTNKKESLFNYQNLPGNPSTKNKHSSGINEEYNPDIVVLPSELSKAQKETNKAQEIIKEKDQEIKKLEKQLTEEKNKGFFKRLFS